MPQYEWTGSGEFRDNLNARRVAPGETVRLPERVGEPNDELVRVEDGGDDSPTEAEAEPEAEAPFDPADHTVEEIRGALDGRPDDVSEADLRALLDAEREGKARETAIGAIESALEE